MSDSHGAWDAEKIARMRKHADDYETGSSQLHDALDEIERLGICLSDADARLVAERVELWKRINEQDKAIENREGRLRGAEQYARRCRELLARVRSQINRNGELVQRHTNTKGNTMNDYATSAQRSIGPQVTSEPPRAIASTMGELASTCMDLENEIRRLVARIAPAIPGGSPFDRVEKQGNNTPPPPAPMRSHMTDELQARIDQLRTLAGMLNGISERIEL